MESGQYVDYGKEQTVTLPNRIGICIISLVAILGSGSSAYSRAVRLFDGDNGAMTELEGVRIDSIEIENRNIYDTDDDKYRAWYYRWANKLHIVSRKRVLKRELLFHVGDTFSIQLAEEVARNLRRRYPLNDAWIETERLANGVLLVRIVTVDRWSLVGGGEVSRDGNETNYTIGFEERNFLGTNRLLLLEYSIYETEKDFVTASFRDIRLFGKPYSLRWDFRGEATNKIHGATLSRPFYNLDQRLAFSLGYIHGGGRKDVYDNGDLIAQSQINSDRVSAVVTHRWGAYRRKIGFSLQYDYGNLSSRDERIFDPARSSLVDFPEDSLIHQLGLEITGDFPSFTKEQRINGFSYTEDFVLGSNASLTFARAFNSRFDDHIFDLINGRIGLGHKFGHSIVLANADVTFWFRAGNRIRQFSVLSLRLYNNQLNFFTLAIRGRYASDWQNSEINLLNLGGTNGLRGYDRFFQSGNRLLLTNIEGRFFPGFELLSAKIGGVAFVDAGRTFSVGEPIVLHHLNVSVGVGLRISLEKLDKSQLIRIDYALAQDDTWELSFSSGQYF